MSTTFPRTDNKSLGYSREQVEEFLALARSAYDASDDASDDAPDDGTDATPEQARDQATPLTADVIRHTAFAMQKGGYSPAQVDAALERLEDAFAARERESAARVMGEQAWMEQAQATAEIILGRLRRDRGHRFARTSVFSVGYRRTDVDRFAHRLQKYFQEARPLSVDEVRTAVFRPERGGYREAQVDALLDSVIDVMLAVR
ncbi:DivIVA domain-containing protein [Cryobacterium frigoriphilum]|uniref:DivIVA domain-containing protein n=1 Tax=Cryobacterium frigoriphilum TaxID=1259150 RepID=A0A4R9AAE8_9MICO|nr:DivIVA domain-containing protein [Cryobacterium frigoriphilum]TFD55218.1 DivIVA domain-containing protein [Cryobacterium frigoriphilum]